MRVHICSRARMCVCVKGFIYTQTQFRHKLVITSFQPQSSLRWVSLVTQSIYLDRTYLVTLNALYEIWNSLKLCYFWLMDFFIDNSLANRKNLLTIILYKL